MRCILQSSSGPEFQGVFLSTQQGVDKAIVYVLCSYAEIVNYEICKETHEKY